MSLSLMPTEVIGHMASLIQPAKYNEAGVKEAAHDVANLALVNKDFESVTLSKRIELKKVFYLINKYLVYTVYFEKPHYTDVQRPDFDPLAPPQLLDALFTGYDGVTGGGHSFDVYSDEIGDDIKKIATLMPRSLNCNFGQITARDHIFPLAAACFNSQIPIDIIEFLLQIGANPKKTYLFPGGEREVTFLTDPTSKKENSKRYEAIKALFEKYSA